ncbi:hypothetical protein [Amycolatopsis sp. NPDC021455]|uniref:hypothetical protein n=1 Tax=Amycolatopsis sp. NPDC021455 TaxID=3154901 RepID=UPI00340477B7
MSYYVIRDGSAVPAAVIERYRKSAKAFTHDLAWVPFDLSAGTAEECGFEDFKQYVYAIARHVREERQRTQWQGEYEYFVHLEAAVFADTLKRPEALVRRRDGVRELLGPDGTWRPADEDPEGTVAVPISEAEHDRLRWEVARPRWFVARDELPHPVAVVRRIPAVAEAYTRNLRWEPVPPGLELEELPSESTAEDLRFDLETGVRLARRTSGPEYFGFLPRPLPQVYLDDICSVVRRENGIEEVYVRDGLWVRSNRLHDSWYRRLPLGAEEVRRITAGLPRSRCFLVHDGRHLPRAVVHLDGETERVFGHDLEWTTAGLLAEVAAHEHWVVEEVTPGQEVMEAYQLARRVREFRQRHEWDGGVWYFGIYQNLEEAFDIGATRVLVRTSRDSIWGGERYTGRGRWEPTRRLDDISRGHSYDDELALSPAEAEAIMNRLG